MLRDVGRKAAHTVAGKVVGTHVKASLWRPQSRSMSLKSRTALCRLSEARESQRGNLSAQGRSRNQTAGEVHSCPGLEEMPRAKRTLLRPPWVPFLSISCLLSAFPSQTLGFTLTKSLPRILFQRSWQGGGKQKEIHVSGRYFYIFLFVQWNPDDSISNANNLKRGQNQF